MSESIPSVDQSERAQRPTQRSRRAMQLMLAGAALTGVSPDELMAEITGVPVTSDGIMERRTNQELRQAALNKGSKWAFLCLDTNLDQAAMFGQKLTDEGPVGVVQWLFDNNYARLSDDGNSLIVPGIGHTKAVFQRIMWAQQRLPALKMIHDMSWCQTILARAKEIKPDIGQGLEDLGAEPWSGGLPFRRAERMGWISAIFTTPMMFEIDGVDHGMATVALGVTHFLVKSADGREIAYAYNSKVEPRIELDEGGYLVVGYNNWRDISYQWNLIHRNPSKLLDPATQLTREDVVNLLAGMLHQ